MPTNLDSYLVPFIPVIVSIITQTTKFIIFTLKHGFKWEYFFTHGHMPSSHSSFAVSLIITVGYLESLTSGAFAIALGMSMIILDDALRIRMYLGDQGRYLNMLVQSLHLDIKQYPRLKERVGHRTSEVIAGLIYGAFLTSLLIYWLQ